jgi:hypothetical protein
MVVRMTAANGWSDPSIFVYPWVGRLKLAGFGRAPTILEQPQYYRRLQSTRELRW